MQQKDVASTHNRYCLSKQSTFKITADRSL